ncbi:uncharacterized protein SAPINGB_P005995 [Magnusiomyces paraingens]|uniref:Ribonuclease n=1 Tax=Magnusiomyces paraingens TaxID=2606893 RepID=A0A5E8C9V9_9ASCO|nr:uncharacterized protein SAPINGB_P005995 [Saprochaete ingens]VVT58016.1 unnamed protein product [Saprochaete ingens]
MDKPNIPQNPFDSFSYHEPLESPEEFAEPCILGVDEAGRGPVIGPMVYACAFCPLSYKDTLAKAGYNDSKQLTAATRSNLLDVVRADPHVSWAVTVMSARDISSGMLRPKTSAYNLNNQAHDVTIALIQQTLQRGVNIAEIYVDTVGPPASYQDKLSRRFPGIKITVAKKADSLYPIVSAASICAKVTRDECLVVHDESGNGSWGSGYPSDPRTVAWLKSSVDPLFGYSGQVRFSWSTVTDLLSAGRDVKWADDYDEEAKKKAKGVGRYFSNESKEEKEDRKKMKLEELSVSNLWYGKPGGKKDLWM